MRLPSLSRSAVSGPLLIAMVFGVRAIMAQTPIPDGAERHPSDYFHPLRTWTRYEPDRARGLIRHRQTSAANLTGKLQSIVIPRIEFLRTTLPDAVEFLRLESRRLDPDPNPYTRGVDIFLRLPKPSPTPDTFVESVPGLPLSLSSSSGVDSNTRISLTMERLPLLEALKYVAGQAGLKVAVEEYAVFIVPLSYAIPTLVTIDYGVPPELLGRDVDTSTEPERTEVQAWFESKGVTFPPGAAAIYLPGKRRLIVRNTQENLDKVVSVISSALKPPTPTPADP